MHFETVHWDDPRALALRTAMDVEMTALYAGRSAAQSDADQAAVTAALAIDPETIVHTVIAIDDDGSAVGHAALRPLGESLEVKKVFISEEARGRGLSRALMGELERAALERDIHSLVLQTGNLQLAAIALYEAVGYRSVEVWAPYTAIPASLCYRKDF